MYTCLSGFVDICEPVEEAFKREAFEEAGAILPGKTSAGLEAMHRKWMETDNITHYITNIRPYFRRSGISCGAFICIIYHII